MSNEKKRKAGGAKLTRTETVTVRLDEKLRYLAELAARKQRRTLSSFVEWAVQDSLERVVLRPATSGEPAKTVASEATGLWDVDDGTRFVKLASDYPELLTYQEQLQLNLLINQLIWDCPDPDASDPQAPRANHLANETAMRQRVAMVRAVWKTIRAMSSEELLQGNFPESVAPASTIAEAARQAYKDTSAAAQNLRLLHTQKEQGADQDL